MSSKPPLVYIGGSMANRESLLLLSAALRKAGLNVFNEWAAPGEQTDQKWKEFTQAQGFTFLQALAAPHAQDVFNFDKTWLDQADAFVLLLPAGRSAHTELGYMAGMGKPAYVFMAEEPERYDVMLLFATGITNSLEQLLKWLHPAQSSLGFKGWALTKDGFYD